MEITADSINVSSHDPAVSQRTPAGGPADAVGWLSMSRLPADHPWVTVRRPDGERLISVPLPVVFFRQLHPKFPRGAELRPAGDRVASRGTPADELIWMTSANHSACTETDVGEAMESCRQETPLWTLGQLTSTVEAGRSRVLVQLHENETWDVCPCYPVLYRFERYCSRIAPVLFPCLPYCSRFFLIFLCFSSTGQYRGGCFRPISPFLPISPRFSPLLPCHSHPLPGLHVFSRITNIWRNGPIRDMCNGGIRT